MPDNIGNLYNTKMPALSETADIQEALRLYHYGAPSGTGPSDYDPNNTNTANLKPQSVAYYLNNLQSQISSISGSLGVQASVWSAKGVLVSATAPSTPTAVTVGSDGFVLTANSATSTGLEWASPAVTLVNSVTLTNKTLTAPKISSASFIADTNGNELIAFPATVASAANEITVSNATTGNRPSIAATGGDTNISLNLISKGTGTVQANGVEIVTTTGSQVLTNKTLTTPTISNLYLSDSSIVFEGSGGDDANETTLTVVNPTADRTITLPNNSGTVALLADTTFIGTTSVALNRTSANLALTGISSVAFPGATSGTVTLQPTAIAGTTTITLPAVTGTVALQTDVHFIGTTSVALNRASANLALTGISSVALPGSTSGTVTLQPTAVAGTTTITLPASTGTVALQNDTHFIGTTSVALNRASANLALTGISSVAMPGSTSGTITLQPTAVAGTTTITLPATTGTVALLGNKISDFAAVTSAELAGKISDETGTGFVVFSENPTLTGTPLAPTAIAGTNTTQIATTAYAYQLEDFISIALSDETTNITTGTAKVTWRAPFAMTLTQIPRASLATASTSGNPTVDINEGGTSILGVNKLSIDANELTSVTAATPTTLADTAIADDAIITFDIDVAGTGAKGLKVTLYYKRA